MKDFFSGVVKWKTSTCFIFTASVFYYLFFCFIYKNQTVSVSILWGLLLVSMAASFFQALCFSDWIIKKMRYTLRSLLFVVLFLPTLAFAAWRLNWFPADKIGAWVIFIVTFFVIFIVMTVSFDIYFQITGRRYDGLIGRYRRQKEDEDNPPQ